MTADLPPDVRDRAIFEAREVLFSWIEGRSIDPELAPAIVVAVVAVLAPEIERPLQARITELEKTLSDNRKLWDESIAQTGAALEQSRRIYAEFVTGQHEEALTRVELLTAALTTVVDKNDLGCSGGCAEYYGAKYPGNWCGACVARAALAAGATESCTCDSDGCAYGDGDCPVCQRLEGTGQRCPHDESEGK